MFSYLLSSLYRKLVALFWYYFRPFLKIFLRKTTGLCELQRICYRTENGAIRCINVEKSLNDSNCKSIKKINEKLSYLADKEGKFNTSNKDEVVKLIEYAIEAICIEKLIKPELHQEFITAMRVCFLQIFGYKQLIFEVEQLRSTAYDSENKSHEEKLLLLWKTLVPDVELKSRVTKQWTEIGFQGDDPKTDFRGMGILGLENLIYFSSKYENIARQILLHSNHPTNGYPFACTGINLTSIAVKLLKSGQLRTHYYNSYFGTFCLEDFHKIYCYLFITFDHFWLKEKPKNVMEFRFIREKFINELEEKLSDLTTILKIDSIVEIL